MRTPTALAEQLVFLDAGWPSDDSLQRRKSIGALLPGDRKLNFALPAGYTRQSDKATSFRALVQGASAAFSYWDPKSTKFSEVDESSITVTAEVGWSPYESLEDEVASYSGGGTGDSVRVPMDIQVGGFANRPLSITGRRLRFDQQDLVNVAEFPHTRYSTNLTTTLVCILRWGGFPDRLLLPPDGSAANSNDETLPLFSYLYISFNVHTTGTNPRTRHQGFVTHVQDLLSSAQVRLMGALPDRFLYDYSGKYTISPYTTMVEVKTNSFFGFSPLRLVQAENLFPSSNQYDAGYNSFKYGDEQGARRPYLGSRFRVPAPVEDNGSPDRGLTPGGNACGPVSLSLLIASNPNRQKDITSHQRLIELAYKNTMWEDAPRTGKDYRSPPLPPGATNSFLLPRAEDWLSGRNLYDRVPYSGYTFAGPTTPIVVNNRQRSVSSYFIVAAKGNPRLEAEWNVVDAVLAEKQPVLFRTSLSTSDTHGWGHIICLFGHGRSQDIADLYGLSGEYYVVADPAGHYYADTRANTHYQRASVLATNGSGVAYGGWFAMYPKELLREMIFDRGLKTNRLTALTLGNHFLRKNLVRLRMNSPLVFTVTDSAGRRAGFLEDGSVVNDIPGARVQSGFAEEQGEEGGSYTDIHWPKEVILGSEGVESLRLELVGIGDGEYSFEISRTDQLGGFDVIEATNGTVKEGERMVRSVDFSLAGQPRPRVSVRLTTNNRLELSWPASTRAPRIESATELTRTTTWRVVDVTLSLDNGGYRALLELAGERRFFRVVE